MGEWIEHNSHNPPRMAPAALVEWIPTYWGHPRMDPFRMAVLEPVSAMDWRPGVQYHVPCDGNGLPYVDAEGLEEWADYVATDASGGAVQIGMEDAQELPGRSDRGWGGDDELLSAPERFRHPGYWHDSLYRVWRRSS